MQHRIKFGSASGARRDSKSDKGLPHQRFHALDTGCPQAYPPWLWTTRASAGVTSLPGAERSAGLGFAALPVKGQVEERFRHPLPYERESLVCAGLDTCEPFGLGSAPGPTQPARPPAP